jgi:hypothetical protein
VIQVKSNVIDLSKIVPGVRPREEPLKTDDKGSEIYSVSTQALMVEPHTDGQGFDLTVAIHSDHAVRTITFMVRGEHARELIAEQIRA